LSQPDLVEVATRLELPGHDLISQLLVSTLTLTHRFIPSNSPHSWAFPSVMRCIQIVRRSVYTVNSRGSAAPINAGHADDEFASSDAERGRVCERTGKQNGVGMSAVNLDDKAGLVLIDLHNGILGLLTAVPPTR
jgi:hypothetical protein